MPFYGHLCSTGLISKPVHKGRIFLFFRYVKLLNNVLITNVAVISDFIEKGCLNKITSLLHIRSFFIAFVALHDHIQYT